MWKLMFTGDLITGFNRPQVIDNLAELLGKNPEAVANELFKNAPVCVKEVESEEEAGKWRRRFADRGALLVALPEDESSLLGSRFVGANPRNVNVAEPTIASVLARSPALRRRNQAFMLLGLIALMIAVVLAVVLTIGG